MGSTPTIGSRTAPDCELRGIFIGVDLIEPILKKSSLRLFTLLLTAAIIFTCFPLVSLADGYAYSLSGSTIINGTGNMAGSFKTGILTLGNAGSGKSLKSVNIRLEMIDKSFEGSLQYRICTNKHGWQEWTDNGTTTGYNNPGFITGIQIKLTGKLADAYSIWYSAWTDIHKDLEGWVCDGAVAASGNEGRRIEEIRIMLVRRNRMLGSTDISFRSYMESTKWEKSWKYNKLVSGRPGKNKRLEAIEITLRSNEYTGSIQYRSLMSGDRSWQSWVSDGGLSGSISKKKRMEAIAIRLTGEVALHYDIYYRTYVGGLGWFNWSKNGESSGSRGIGRRIEAIQIALVRKGGKDPGALKHIRSSIGYNFVSKNSSTGVSEWKIGTKSNFGSAVLRRAKYYNRTEYKDMRCDALVAQCLADALGTDLGKASKNSKYARLNEWIGLSALESLLSSTFTYKDANGKTVICRPVAKTKLKKLMKKTWKRKYKQITEEEFNTWLTNHCKPGDIIIFYNKNKKPIHCGIYSGVQVTSVKEFEYFRGKKKGEKEIDMKPGHYMWHSGYDTGVANKYAFWVAEVGRSYYIRRYRVDSGKMQPPAPVQQYNP